jgi:hypothetical protein
MRDSNIPRDAVRLDRVVAQWIARYAGGDDARKRELLVTAVRVWNACIARERTRLAAGTPNGSEPGGSKPEVS